MYGYTILLSVVNMTSVVELYTCHVLQDSISVVEVLWENIGNGINKGGRVCVPSILFFLY